MRKKLISFMLCNTLISLEKLGDVGIVMLEEDVMKLVNIKAPV